MLLLLLLAAVPEGRYVMTLDGAPAGVVAFTLAGNRYTYTSTHFYRSRQRVRQVVANLDHGRWEGRVPEVLWLSTLPAVGCIDVIEELTHRTEQVCIDTVTKAQVTGRLDGAMFTARYDETGRLALFDLPPARFTASNEPVNATDPFANGFAVTGAGSQLTLSPPDVAVRQVTVEGAGLEAELAQGQSCLELARARAKTNPSLTVVIGLVVEDGRAWSHAWLETRAKQQLDPSVLPSDEVLTRRQYLAFSGSVAGRLYLELLRGTRTVVRSP